MKYRVLIIHNILWSHYKGVVFSELYNILRDEGMDFFVLQMAVTENRRKNLGELDLSCHQYPYELLFNCSIEEIPPYKEVSAILKELFSRKYDIIVMPGYSYLMCWCALLVSKLMGKKIIVSFDSTVMDHKRTWYKEFIKGIFIRYCNAAFCYGTKSKEYLQLLGMNPKFIFTRCQATNNENIKTVCESAKSDRDAFIQQYGVSRHNFIYVGRLSEEKNIETLVLAFKKVKKENTLAETWGLIVVGEGTEKDHLQKIISENIVPDVYFVGGQSWVDVARFYAISDVFVLPSLSEPWGLVVNEAMVCGLPVVVSDKCGAAYDLVIEGDNGFVFKAGDVDGLSENLCYFVENMEDIEKMAASSRRIIANYTPLHAAQQMREGFLSLLDN